MKLSQGEGTRPLIELLNEERQLEAKHFSLVRDELDRFAADYVRQHPKSGITAEELVRALYARLLGAPASRTGLPAEFFAAAAPLVRRTLADGARRQTIFSVRQAEFLRKLDEALTRLARFDQGLSRLVELRFFGGLSLEEAAGVLKVAPLRVAQEWDLARSWLRAEIAD